MIAAATRATTVCDALDAAAVRFTRAGVPEPRADAEVLLAHVLGSDRAALVVRAREALAPDAAARFEACIVRRTAREPAAYITGVREFWSLPIAVDRRVLVPRPETETLVETALRVAPGARRVLDVGTGSGAIAVAIARELPAARVVACDLMAPALAVAAANRARLAPAVALVRADLARAFRPAAFDLVVANPPYCPTGTVVQAEVRDWEPASALYAGADGLDVVTVLVDETPRVLRAGGWLALEIATGQATAVVRRVEASGAWDRWEVVRDLAGIERVVAARRGA
jgi:release factor glutamine methyltransferase